MATKDHGPSIKDDEQYEALRKEGMSKEKAARIANESASSSRSESDTEVPPPKTMKTGPSRSFGAARGDRHVGLLGHEQVGADRRAQEPLTRT